MGLDDANRFSELAEARPVVCSGVQHSKKLCLSLLMSKNLKLKKVNKSFVPEPKKRVVSVSCFSDSDALWTFVNVFRIRMNMSISRVRILVVYFWTWIYYISFSFYKYFQICCYFTHGKIFTTVLTGRFSLKFKWEYVSSGLQDSFMYKN